MNQLDPYEIIKGEVLEEIHQQYNSISIAAWKSWEEFLRHKWEECTDRSTRLCLERRLTRVREEIEKKEAKESHAGTSS